MRAERHQFDVEGTGSLWLIECHDESTKSLPVKAEDGSGLHRLDAKVEVHTTPPGIETCFSGKVWARDRFSLTHRLCARSDVGWGNRAWRQPAHKRVRQAGKNSPVKCGRCAVNDGAAHNGAGLNSLRPTRRMCVSIPPAGASRSGRSIRNCSACVERFHVCASSNRRIASPT